MTADLVALPVPRPCRKCGLPSEWASARARTKGLHPTCAGPAGDVSEPVLRLTVQMIRTILPVAVVGREGVAPFVCPPTDHYRIERPFVTPPAPWPCAVCGAIEGVIHWLPPHDVWRCWEHGPLRYAVQAWERRGFPGPAP